MTPKELIKKLISQEGPCLRLCSYCPEEFDTREVKECVEKMIRDIYALRSDNEELEEELIKVKAAYREATGHPYKSIK